MTRDEPDYTQLMTRRIRRVLLVCNNYDSYTLEEDGRIENRIAQDYADLNLSNPPEFKRVETTVEALDKLNSDILCHVKILLNRRSLPRSCRGSWRPAQRNA